MGCGQQIKAASLTTFTEPRLRSWKQIFKRVDLFSGIPLHVGATWSLLFDNLWRIKSYREEADKLLTS